MNCPRCNAEVSDSATFCPNCGSSIRPTMASFSYLPAGAPPWPTSTAQLPASIATLPGLRENGIDSGTSQNGVAQIAVKPKVERPRRSPGGVLVVTGILILAVIVGAGLTLGSLYTNGQLAAQAPAKPVALPKATATSATATPGTSVSPTATTTTDLPTPTSFQSISKTDITNIKASLKIPADWQEDTPQLTNGTAALHFHPQQQLGIDFSVVRFSSTDSATFSSPDALNQAAIASYQSLQGVTNLQSITPVAAQRTIGGATWTEQDATFDVAGSAGTIQYHITSISTQHSNVYYNILFYTPSLVYTEAFQKYFQPIFASYQFTA